MHLNNVDKLVSCKAAMSCEAENKIAKRTCRSSIGKILTTSSPRTHTDSLSKNALAEALSLLTDADSERARRTQ